MKKLLSLLLVLCVLPFCAIAEDSAEEPIAKFEAILDEYSFDELMAFNSIVQLRLFKKAILSNPNGVIIPAGEGYVVGTDFPAGTYRFELPGLSAYEVCIIDIDLHDGGYTHTHLLMSDGSKEIGKLELPVGATVNILSGPVRIFQYTGIFH